MTTYHQKVAQYYDEDARMGFEQRADENPLLQRIRDDFRAVTTKYPFSKVLEIGCGPGLDVEWFAQHFPDSSIKGVDISPEMVNLARKRIEKAHLSNAELYVLNENELLDKFGESSFDMIYVYFGALNTVADLSKSAEILHKILEPGGHMVLSFVNKWYLREMIVQALKLNPGAAFARLRKEWGGYSTSRHLPSRCYSPNEIYHHFRQFDLLYQKGYSIFYPAWYNFRKFQGKENELEKLWQKDQKAQNGFWWSKGEYALYVFKKTD